MATKNDKVILSLKKEIEAKKKLLAKSSKFTPITNCSLELDGKRTNLHVATKDELLLLIAKLNAYEQSLKSYMPKVDSSFCMADKLTISGYATSEWLSDLSGKYNNLNVSIERDRLQKLEAKLHELLSVDTKVELEIENLKSQI